MAAGRQICGRDGGRSLKLQAVQYVQKGGGADEYGNTDRGHRDRRDALLRRKVYL